MATKTKTRTEPWRAVHRAADSHVARFREPFIASVNALRRRVSITQLEESAAKGEMTWELFQAIDGIKVAKIAATPTDLATKVYAQIITEAVQGQAAYVEGVYGPAGATIVGRFDVVSPQVLRAAETLTADLIRGVSTETKMAVRRIIFNSIQDGVAPRDAAKQIRQIIGLTSRQAMAVNRLQKGLLDGGMDFMTSERQAGRYAQRLLRDRAENIARTETMRAANRGQQLLWTEMQGAGILPPDFTQRWLVTPDDRLCPRCAPMQGREVQLGYLFRETERGVLPSKRVPFAGANVQGPPLHPRCRCTLVAVDDLADVPALPSRPQAPATVEVPDWVTESYAVLDPKRKTTFADEIASRKSPGGRDLQAGVNRFSGDAEEARDLRAAGERLVAGSEAKTETERYAHRMLEAIAKGPTREGVLYRGMGVPEDVATLLSDYKVGSEFNLGLSSFTSSQKVAKGFASENAFKGTQVLIRTKGDIHALPAEKVSQFASEKEWISSGRFRVTKIQVQDDVVSIDLEQFAVDEAVVPLAKAAMRFDHTLAGSFAEERHGRAAA